MGEDLLPAAEPRSLWGRPPGNLERARATHGGSQHEETTHGNARHEGSPAGGYSGFDDFYQASYGRLAAQLHAYLGDRGEAEDVTQEAFVRTWQRWSEISRYEDPVSWVRRVAWNLATSRMRHLNVAARALRRHDPPPNAPALSPDHVMLVAALRQLPDRQRLAMVLHYIADLPVADVATDLGVPKGTVVSWLHRSRAQLASHFAGADGAPGTGSAGPSGASPEPNLRKR